jgi:haloalkane dehalogenase
VVLLLHGNPTWSFMWRQAIPALVRAGHRVIALDLLGFGRSDKPTTLAAYTVDRHVTRLSTLWQSLDAHEVSLVVHDWGGPIGLWWLEQAHVPIRRLVVFNTFSPVLPGKQGQTAALGVARVASQFPPLADIMYRRGHLMLRDLLFGSGTLHHKSLPAAVRAAYWAPHRRVADRTGVLAFPLQIPRHASDRVAQRSRGKATARHTAGDSEPAVLGHQGLPV